MSSTQFSPLPSGSFPAPPPTYKPPNNTSTLLFGFLVSALSIFAVFMSSALVWNRLVARRHAIEATLAVTMPRDPQRLQRPIIWDIWAAPDEQLPQWLNVKPVAAQECDCPADSSLVSQTAQATSFWRRHLLSRLPPEIVYLFYRPTPQASSVSSVDDIPGTDLTRGSNVQISLLISMPYSSKSAHEGRGQRKQFHELVFATTNVHYHDPSTT